MPVTRVRVLEVLGAGVIAAVAIACSDVTLDAVGRMAVDAGEAMHAAGGAMAPSGGGRQQEPGGTGGELLRDASMALMDAGAGLIDAGTGMSDAGVIRDAAAQSPGPTTLRLESDCDTVIRTRDWDYPDDDRFSLHETFYAEFDIGEISPSDIAHMTVITCDSSSHGLTPVTCPEGATCRNQQEPSSRCRLSSFADVEQGVVRVNCGYRQRYRSTVGGVAIDHGAVSQSATISLTLVR